MHYVQHPNKMALSPECGRGCRNSRTSPVTHRPPRVARKEMDPTGLHARPKSRGMKGTTGVKGGIVEWVATTEVVAAAAAALAATTVAVATTATIPWVEPRPDPTSTLDIAGLRPAPRFLPVKASKPDIRCSISS